MSVSEPQASAASDLRRTPLHAVHRALGARMTPFAGWDMPVQYEGVLAEHRWTRDQAGLFDVSHMGQARLRGAGAEAVLESLTPSDLLGLAPNRQRYSLLLAEDGGVLDDLMVSRPDADGLFVVVNAAGRQSDFDLIEQAAAGFDAELERLDDRALLALQGPAAAEVLSAHAPLAAQLGFMQSLATSLLGEPAIISRSGYTGEDGFEISVPAGSAEEIWTALLADARVRPIGLGARDSLRLEAGLPLYGSDVDATTSPVEAGLDFALARRRLEAMDFRGAERVRREREGQLSRVRVGLRVSGAPARAGADLLDPDGQAVGRVTSGVPSPTLGFNIAMAYAPPALARPEQLLMVSVRGRAQPAEVTAMPFVPKRFVRKP